MRGHACSSFVRVFQITRLAHIPFEFKRHDEFTANLPVVYLTFPRYCRNVVIRDQALFTGTQARKFDMAQRLDTIKTPKLIVVDLSLEPWLLQDNEHSNRQLSKFLGSLANTVDERGTIAIGLGRPWTLLGGRLHGGSDFTRLQERAVYGNLKVLLFRYIDNRHIPFFYLLAPAVHFVSYPVLAVRLAYSQ